VRIFIIPPDLGGVRDGLLVRKACEILSDSNLLSARPGGIVGDYPVILVDEPDVANAIQALEYAGIRCFRDPLTPMT
jgi:hypothetical protein